MRTANQIEESKEKSVKAPRKKHATNPNSLKNLCAPWPKGVSANPGGEPGFDVAAWLCRKVIERNVKEAYAGFSKQLAIGNAYALNVLADRGYGKLKERKEVTHKHESVPDADLDKRLTELLRDLGLASQIDEAGAPRITGGEEKTNGAAKDPVVLP